MQSLPEMIPGTMELLFAWLVLVVAFLYAAVGHGGASGYLALMALFSFTPEVMKSTALLMNLAVSAIAFFHYYRAGHFRPKLFLPFAVTSVPLSFLGSLLMPEGGLYRVILGIVLLVPAFRLFGIFSAREKPVHDPPVSMALVLGALIGFVSGMIGVGGGILLSPLLIGMHWAGMKQTAAVSALFIFVNSLAALAAIWPGGITLASHFWWWMIAAAAGGLAGSRLGSGWMKQEILKRILGAVLLLASLKLMIW